MSAAEDLDRTLRIEGTTIVCVDETGSTALPVPPSLPTHAAAVVRPSSPLDLLDSSSYARAVTAFLTALNEGTASAVVQLASNGESRRLQAWDLRASHECVVLTISDADGDEVPVAVPHEVANPPARILRSRVDATGRTIEIDSAVTEMLGWQPADFLGASSLLKLHPDDHDMAMRSFADLLARPGGQSRIRDRLLHSDGSWRWFEVTQTNRLHEDPPHIQSEAIDIEAEMETITALKEREALLALLTHALPIGVLHMQANGTPDEANDAWHRLLPNGGIDDLDALVRCLSNIEQFEAAAIEARDNGTSHQLAVTLRFENAPKRYADLQLHAVPATSAPHGLLITLADTTEIVTAHRDLGRITRRDRLTNVLNRFGLEEQLSVLLEELDGTHEVTVLCIDLDGFKDVNDSLGHRRADDILVSVAAEIRHQVRSTDLVARLGGDEFIAVLRETAAKETQEIIGRLRQNLTKLSTDWELPSMLGASIGVATIQAGDSFDSLMARADEAMYAEKARRD